MLYYPIGGDERQQVLPMLAQIRLTIGKPGNPKRRPKTLAADKRYDARWLRYKLRSKGIRPQIKKRQVTGKNLKKDQSRKLYLTTNKSALSRGFNASIEDSLFDGNA